MFPYLPFAYPFYAMPYPSQVSLTDVRFSNEARQQAVRGQATWTEGGEVTKCNLSWSANNFMTAAVGEDSPYQCGDYIRIRNIGAPYGREIVVMVVDEVVGYPPNRINLQRRAFQALGVNPNIGVLNVEIMPMEDTETEMWGAHLVNVVRVAFPAYQLVDYRLVSKSKVSENVEKESYTFSMQHGQESIEIVGDIIYNPHTNRILSIKMEEV